MCICWWMNCVNIRMHGETIKKLFKQCYFSLTIPLSQLYTTYKHISLLFILLCNVIMLPGAHPASCTMGTGSFPGVKYGRDVLLTTHHLLVPWSWKSRAIPLPTLWATTGPVMGTLYLLYYYAILFRNYFSPFSM